MNAARRARFEHAAAAVLLAAFVAALFARLLFTNRVLATGDILLYFYPYREFAAAALRAGELPLWNPYVFLGAPFLANPQAAVLYPLHWPLAWLNVTQQVYWSAAVHAWLFGYGGYWLLRRWGYGLLPGLAAALALAGSGYLGGQIGHLNQLNCAAWLPWAVLLVTPFAAPPTRRAAWLVRGVLFGGVVALMLLAGHTQTTYINLFGVGVWALAVSLLDLDAPARGLRARLRFRPAPLLTYAGGVALGAVFSAAQLLPTLELSGLGLRSGGLSYLDATSFSLKPLQLPWTLLPTYGLLDAGAIFDTPAYTEFIAYVGVAGLALALLGAWRGRGAARAFGLLFALLGLFLAAGRWNPLYAILYWAVPGFDLFRAPARWLLLYTLGAGVLAGVGVHALATWLRTRRIPAVDDRRSESRDRMASVPPVIHPTVGAVACVVLLAVDLLLAARALPHTHPTAPEAVYGMRTAPAHLLTDPDLAALGAASGRFLGMSTITYDPGDMADLERIYRSGDRPLLSPRAFDDLIVALKVQELIVPNLAMLRRLPAVDGYDGGVLPLRRYNLLAQVLVPPEDLVPDGRLREQIAAMPSTAQLNLFNAQYVITDKVRDLWYDGVYYDRQIGARLMPASPAVALDVPAPFPATHLDLIATVDGDPAGLADGVEAVATVTVTGTDGTTHTLSLTAGGAPGAQLADGALDSPLAASSGAEVAYRDVDGGRQEYRVRLDLGAPMTPAAIEIARGDTAPDMVVQAATLFDERTGMFLALLPSDRGRFRLAHSGDVKIYENLDLLPRAYLVARTLPAATPEDALRLLQAPGFDPEQAAVVEGDEGNTALDGSPAPGDRAEIVSYAPERVAIRTQSAGEALLVLADAVYPGWSATVDGAPAPIYPTDVLLRGVRVPPGEHTVVFTFAPPSLRRGIAVSGGALLLGAVLLLAALLRLRGGARPGV